MGGLSAPLSVLSESEALGLEIGIEKAGVAQSVERLLGKDEVSGSNPDTSSIIRTGSLCFARNG